MSAPTILLRTVGGIDDKRIVLSEGQFARKLFVGSNWTTLRVGIRYSVTDPGINMVSGPRFRFGLCAGTANIPGDASVDNFFGLTGPINSGWTRFTDQGPTPYFWFGYPIIGSELGLSVSTIRGGPVGGPGENLFAGVIGRYLIPLSTSIRKVLFATYSRTPSGYALSLLNYLAPPGSVQQNDDVSQDTFISQMREPNPTIPGHSQSGAIGDPAGVAGLTPALDSVCCFWDRSIVQWEISDLAVMRFS